MNITTDQITAGAKWIAKNMRRLEWDGIRPDGRASDHGFDPWRGHNARQEDYRDAIHAILAEMGIG